MPENEKFAYEDIFKVVIDSKRPNLFRIETLINNCKIVSC